MAPPTHPRLRAKTFLLRSTSSLRQDHTERAAYSRGALDLDTASPGLDQLLDKREAESQPLRLDITRLALR